MSNYGLYFSLHNKSRLRVSPASRESGSALGDLGKYLTLFLEADLIQDWGLYYELCALLLAKLTC